MTSDGVTIPIVVARRRPRRRSCTSSSRCSSAAGRDLAQRLLGRRDRRPEPPQTLRQALIERGAVSAPRARATLRGPAKTTVPPPLPLPPAPPPPSGPAAAPTGPNWITRLSETRLHLLELRRRRPRDLPVDPELLPPGLDLRDDLRHGARLVHGRRAPGRTTTDSTPSTFATWFACVCENVSCVPGRKNVWSNFSPGLPSFERSVITELFACTTSRPPPAAARPETASRVLRRGERDGEVGADARERVERSLLGVVQPTAQDAITTTSATPTASPETVTIVRPRRRPSSLRA